MREWHKVSVWCRQPRWRTTDLTHFRIDGKGDDEEENGTSVVDLPVQMRCPPPVMTQRTANRSTSWPMRRSR
jgi:hypothetical protein